MLASFNNRLRLELLLYSIKLFLFYNGCVKAFIDIPFVFDLTYVDGIDQNVAVGNLFFSQQSSRIFEGLGLNIYVFHVCSR